MITAEWESKLDDVSKGKSDYKSFISGIQTTLQENIDLIKSTQGKIKKLVNTPCPKCGEELIKRKAKTGNGFWWGCSGYQNG